MWRLLRNRRLILRLYKPTIFSALIYWAHRAVILAIAWFTCISTRRKWDKSLAYCDHNHIVVWRRLPEEPSRIFAQPYTSRN